MITNRSNRRPFGVRRAAPLWIALRPVQFLRKASASSRRLLPAVGLFLILQAWSEPPLPQVERLESSPVLRHLKPNPFSGEPRTAAERTVAQMYVPEGFQVDLIAAEPDIHQPVAFAWDARGRIWVLEAYSYPTKRPEGQGLDKVVIFSDENGDGTFESRKVFAEGLNLASGIEVGYGGVWIGAAPELLFLPDRNLDDRPDGPPQVMLDGFGYQDTHETLNSFMWGPDGWLYGIQGVFNTARIGRPEAPREERPELRAGVWRFHPVRHEFEIFAHGGSNPWGLDYDERGQLFMTHCRSRWGRGLTTHVIQGAQMWNQVNGHYAPFIVANPPRGFPEFRNYLLASARYGHGAGGAGPRGSDAIYGAPSHVGTMFYLGNNWPDKYRGHLFTHNLGGHQINQQINQPIGSGYDTVHAGKDMLFCTDPSYVAVDLQYGPDGAVYMIDWVDPQHCHNPNTERWDRTNGRIYRMQWQETFEPIEVDLRASTDLELMNLLGHNNQWFGRTALRLLDERHLQTYETQRQVDANAVNSAIAMAKNDSSPIQRLRGLWAARALGKFNGELVESLLADADEYVRAWVIQLRGDIEMEPKVIKPFVRLARSDPSPVVRRALASVIQRVEPELGWQIGEALAGHGEDKDDRNLPFLIWHGLGPLVSGDVSRAFEVAKQTRIPQLADWIYWYAATLEGDPLNQVVGTLAAQEDESLHKRLAGVWLAMEPRANLPMPAAWNQVAPKLYGHSNAEVQRLAEQLASVFGDDSAFPRLRTTLANGEAERGARQHAFAVLSRAQDRASLEIFMGLLQDDAFRLPAIKLLARFNAPNIPQALVDQFNSYSPAEKSAALLTLTGRVSSAISLLDAVASDAIERDELTAFHIRQMSGLRNGDIDRRVAAIWGPIKQTPSEKLERIDRLDTVFSEAPLWAYNARAGRQHFELLCAQCHRLGDVGQPLGPELTGAGKHGVRYYLENVIDPDAVIGAAFQLTTVETRSDQLLSGLLINETASAVTVRTPEGEMVIPRADIQELVRSEKSMMPEGLLEALNDREQIELLKFLMMN